MRVGGHFVGDPKADRESSSQLHDSQLTKREKFAAPSVCDEPQKNVGEGEESRSVTEHLQFSPALLLHKTALDAGSGRCQKTVFSGVTGGRLHSRCPRRLTTRSPAAAAGETIP